jgi:adenylylsulfate kinase
MIKPKSTNTVWHHATVTRERRAKLNQHKSVVLWFTGLSGSGKSTLAHAVEEQLHRSMCRTYVLDGDNVRHGLCGDLGFSEQDREENIRRISEISRLFIDAGVIILTAFISPFYADREKAKALIGDENFIQIYCKCPLEICEERDVKGSYQRAKKGEIKEFTGISSPYEEPENQDLVIDTGNTSLKECVNIVVSYLVQKIAITMP